jgi:predicted metalloprotease with PDZ domain
MQRNIIKSKILFLLIFTFIFSGYQQQAIAQNTAPEIKFTVSMSKPWTHLLEVETQVNWANMPGKLEMKMPVWTPGSYLVREYARHVQDFTALDANGNALNWQKINKNTWEIDTKGAKGVRIGYQVYANELTVRTNELNDQHAFFTPAALLMFPKGQLSASSNVTVKPYRDWKVATGLPEVAGQKNTFTATNFDILYDSPFEVSNFVEKKFTVMGKPHRYVITGEGNFDLDKMAEDTAKIVEEAAKIFGELPYNDYTFILNLRGGGGLEHLNSTALQWNQFGFQPAGRYNAFLGLVAHEYFHLFNVKRIRPDALGPFDYENENYTKLLWVAEGATSYYQSLLMRRANLLSDKDVLQGEARTIESLEKQPGRFETSLEDASFDAWIKYYRRDENGVNNQISYYDKGELVNFLLDIEIRAASNGAKSLDDVMRYLYNEHYKKGKNYTPADYQRISEMMAGKSLDNFFKNYVRGTEEINYDATLNKIGLRLAKLRAESDNAYLGANLSESNGNLKISSLPADSPAYASGLNADDEILAVDGYKTNRSFLDYYLTMKKAGDKVKFTVFRRDKLREIEVTLGKTPASGYTIIPVSDPTDEQKQLYKNYLLEDLK